MFAFRICCMIAVVGCALCARPGAVYSQPACFADGFEPEPFWTVSAQPGCSAAPSTAMSHTGDWSTRFVSTNTGQPKGIGLIHQFAGPIYGRVSVWVYDSGADVGSSNYLALTLTNTALQKNVNIGTFDYDLGPGNGGDVYYYQFCCANQPIRSPIDRTQGWHHWEIDTTEHSLELRIDGVTVYSSPQGEPFDHIGLAMFGPSWRPAWVAYFDDFEFVEDTCRGDLDDDGDVDLADFAAFQVSFGNVCQQ